jgi:hypothetical protein
VQDGVAELVGSRAQAFQRVLHPQQLAPPRQRDLFDAGIGALGSCVHHEDELVLFGFTEVELEKAAAVPGRNRRPRSFLAEVDVA